MFWKKKNTFSMIGNIGNPDLSRIQNKQWISSGFFESSFVSKFDIYIPTFHIYIYIIVREKNVFKLGAQSANRPIRISVGENYDELGTAWQMYRFETRDNVGPFPTRGCTLDKLWRDQRYDEGNAAGINAEWLSGCSQPGTIVPHARALSRK